MPSVAAVTWGWALEGLKKMNSALAQRGMWDTVLP